MKSQTEIVQELMSKHGLTNKDLFSFCICAVNFLEYYYEESMYDMMRSCPERYANADSDNRKAAAGALAAEKKTEKWTDVDQFTHYMESIQEAIAAEIENDGKLTYHFLGEMNRFETVYRREVIVPFMLGCPVEDYDDEQFEDEDYIKSIANVDNLALYQVVEAEREASRKRYEEERRAELAKAIEEKKDDKDFTVLLATSMDISRLKAKYDQYNKTYYPDRDYKVHVLSTYRHLIIQTGGKTIEDVKDTVLRIIRSTYVIIGHELTEELIPVEKAYKDGVPSILKDNGVTHVVTYY